MKKRTLRERKNAFKEAYRKELTKQGIVDEVKEKTVKETTKKAEKSMVE